MTSQMLLPYICTYCIHNPWLKFLSIYKFYMYGYM